MAEFDSDKIKSILSDPKAVDMIAGLVAGMGGGKQPSAASFGISRDTADDLTADSASMTNPVPSPMLPEEPKSAPEQIPPANDLSTALPAMAGLLGAGNSSFGSDKRIALLKAIKPYVNDSKKERVDGLVRAIGVAGILNNFLQ